MSKTKTPTSALIAFIFSLRGNARVLTNVFRYDREALALHILMHGSWISLTSRPTTYRQVVKSIFGVEQASIEVGLLAKLGKPWRAGLDCPDDVFRALWDTRFAQSALTVVVPADAHLESVDGYIRLTKTGNVSSCMHVTCGKIEGWIVETRIDENSMLATNRFTLSDPAAAKKAWKDIQAHEGTSDVRVVETILPEEKLHTLIDSMRKDAEAYVLNEERRVREREQEEQRKKQEAERERERIEAEKKAAALAKQRERERLEALRHKELLGKNVESLTNDDFANRMRAKGAMRQP